ncbi:Lipoxygenase 2.1, chloroplastic [Capsicum annuum]|nr:Lipoxygenase 2.1, chloroplastic [Capsicum annuum]
MQAVEQKKLFILDYHDLLLPYVNKVNELKGTVIYGSRTLFFLTPDGTLRPLAIELTRPPVDDKPQWKQFYVPNTWNATGAWLWKLAKAHVLVHDSGYHQLVSHWLRTHCATEPYIIATNRQLSAMHPIYRLLYPHFRYTMKINALAREALINTNGIIETSFFPGKYAMELSSFAYDLEWRFDQEALPQNLISRGLVEEDPNAPYGLKLTIEDYPFANDEIKNVGHGDQKYDLIGIIRTIVWVTSGHQAAVNLAQYSYAGTTGVWIGRSNRDELSSDTIAHSSAHLFPIESENDVINQKEYASIIGSLRYVTDCTRPDIAYAVGVLSKFTSKPYLLTKALAREKVCSTLRGMGLKPIET